MPTEHDQPDENVPDYRVTLANERTFLAWARTALGLLAGAVAIAQLARAPGWLRVTTSLVLAAVALAVAVLAYLTWRQRTTEIRRGEPITRNRLLLGSSAVLVLLTVLVAMLVFASTS